MLHAVKGKNYDLGGLEISKILKYQEVLNDCLKDYFIPPEATQVSPLIPFSPMPGGALTANTQMMRDNGTLHKFPEVIKAMQEVVEKGGYGTSVTPVSQFYWQQAYANVMFGPWKQIAPGYGRMVLGYFGKTPVEPDADIVKLAAEKLKLEPTKENPLDIADRDEKKKISVWKERLEIEGIPATEENIFIAAACDEKGIAFLKGEAPLNVRKKENESKKGENKMANASGNYTVVVDGQRFNVTIENGNANIQVTPAPVVQQVVQQPVVTPAPVAQVVTPVAQSHSGTAVPAAVNGAVWKILVNEGDTVAKDQQIMILEAMKMEIEITAPVAGVISKILVNTTDSVEEGQALAYIG
jgi:pyruvate carboxylase subunit B